MTARDDHEKEVHDAETRKANEQRKHTDEPTSWELLRVLIATGAAAITLIWLIEVSADVLPWVA
jgi:hypothetical protein